MFWIFFTDSFLFLTFYRFLNRGNLLNVLCLINVELRFGLCSIGSLLLDVIDLLSAWRNNFRISWENNSRNLTGPKLRQLYTFFVCFYEEFNPVLRKGFYLFIYFCTGFVLHWNETAMGLHVFPIPIPPPTSLSTRSLWVFPAHQVRALVSCIQPWLVICFTLDKIHVSLLFSWNIPPSPSPTESKRLFYKSMSLFFSVLHIGLSLTSF